jgi:hypothetical protein
MVHNGDGLFSYTFGPWGLTADHYLAYAMIAYDADGGVATSGATVQATIRGCVILF